MKGMIPAGGLGTRLSEEVGLARDSEIDAIFHLGLTHPMDTLQDERTLENRWERGVAPWKRW